jgi:hypothetical protein
LKLVNLKFTSNTKRFTVKFDMEKNDPRAFVVFNNRTGEAVTRFRKEWDAWQTAKAFNSDHTF